ncbi:MAG: hypothetical protein ACYC6F_02470 [Longimicrobiales bacterium]
MVTESRCIRRAAELVVALLALAPVGMHAQLNSAPPQRPTVPARSLVRTGILGGIAGSAAGILAGGGLGLLVDSCDSGADDCESAPAFVGAILGGVIGSALGAEWAVERAGGSPSRRKLLLAGLAGTLTGAVGSALASVIAEEGVVRLVGFSIGQGTLTGIVAGKR